MLAQVHSCAVIGLDAQAVHVEVDIASGLEKVTLVGLPDTAVRESSERVRAALGNSGYVYPAHRLTVNLAPADLRKEGPAGPGLAILQENRYSQPPGAAAGGSGMRRLSASHPASPSGRPS